MGKKSRDKGKVGEREVVSLLKKYGFKTARRASQFAGNTGEAADILCKELSDWHIESKRVEKFNLYDAYDQVFRDKPSYTKGIIFHRRNHRPAVIIMDAEEFLQFLVEKVYTDNSTNETQDKGC